MRQIRLFAGLITVAGLILLFRITFAPPPTAKIDPENGETYYTVLDEKNQLLFITSVPISVGDRYLTEKNRLYEVARVSGNVGFARPVGTVVLETGQVKKPAPVNSPARNKLIGPGAWLVILLLFGSALIVVMGFIRRHRRNPL